ncbi:cohesin domain-containing protein [uncultured Ruminococcus sp.]|uniref:cohesin domain-containing protein n=1 Tax=uncultured Ruminococcus sp. TaxID=165186 RepID=UPI0026653DF7|nr:cohesin domain-containing protein [uncultured Ruminococcus sp.]
MNNSKHKAKRLSVALLIAVLAVSTSFASVMTGCGNKDESSSTAATVTSTASAAENTTVANDKSESELNTESSTQSSSSNSTANSSQTSEKSESNGSSDSSKAESKSESSKNDASSKNDTSKNDTSKNDSGNKSSDTLSVDGHNYKKGDTVTVTYTVKSTKVLANFQGTITYDSSKLKVKKAELQSPVKSNSIVNAKNAGVIKFNGSDITSGYDFTNGGDLIVVTYEVTGTGSAKTSYLWESASTIENNKIITHIDANGKSDGTVSLSTSYK